jgi:hypothetical protein
MDVSKKDQVNETADKSNGAELLEEVASLTGLPPDWVQTELTKIVTSSGHEPADLTLDELRTSMLAYLEEMQKDLADQEAAELATLEQMTVSPSDLSH